MRIAAACLLLTGCFYIDPINVRPDVDEITCKFPNPGQPCAPGMFLGRNQAVELGAIILDPDGSRDAAKLEWSVTACNEQEQCDERPYARSQLATPVLAWPNDLTNVRGLRVRVDARDERGALASRTDKFWINDPPALELRSLQHRNTMDAPIQLIATYSDPDTLADTLQLDWQVTPPVAGQALVFDDVASQATGDPRRSTVAKRFVPTALGVWTVQATATDDRGEFTVRSLAFLAGPDEAPCLLRPQPIVPPGDATLPIAEPTVFQIPLVDDDLDPYPRMSDDPAFRTASFQWSILRPGATAREELPGATGNTLDFDPGAFTPGQIVELRVDVRDRVDREDACPASEPSCAARPSCLQRLTWRVEVR